MIDFQNVSFSYGEESRGGGIRNINLTIKTGEFVLLTGESGCGKTTIFMITMLIADQTVHAAGGKHSRIHFFCWHFHGSPSLSAYRFFHSTTIPRAWK